MGAPIDQHLRRRQANQSQIANQVEQLMAHRFIIEPQGRIEPLVPVTDQGIVQGTSLNQSGSTQLLHLLTEAERARWGDLLHKTFRREGDR